MKTTPIRPHAGLIATAIFLSSVPLVSAAPEDPVPPPPPPAHAPGDKPGPKHPEHPGKEIQELIAVINPVGDSKVKGTVLFEKDGEKIKITAKIGGLEANSKHAIHIHEFGNLSSNDATSAGSHFNPEGHDHGLPAGGDEKRHAGDFGNLEADADGNAVLTLTVDNLSLAHGPNAIIGRAVIVHAKPDDGGQPTGNAGDRIGAGVIGVSKVGP